MDRASGAEITDPEVIDLTAEEELEEADVSELPAIGVVEGSAAGIAASGDLPDFDQRPPEPPTAPEPLPYHDDDEDRPARLGWIPELVAVLALVALLVAGIWVFTDRGKGGDDLAGPVTTLPISEPTATSTEAPATTEAPTTTAAPATTRTPATTAAPRPPAATGATGTGELSGCRRDAGGVVATVTVTHRSGPPSTFSVSARLVDPDGVEFARGAARTPLIQPGETGSVDVLVPAADGVAGSCELAEVTSA